MNRKNNKNWMMRLRDGKYKKYRTADDLLRACYKYIEFVQDNPLMAAELVKFQGKATVKHVPRMRAMTLTGLWIFLGIDNSTWYRYKDADEDYHRVCKHIDTIIRTQKFEGAAADMLNASIIARDLGLVDKQQIDTKKTVKILKKRFDGEK